MSKFKNNKKIIIFSFIGLILMSVILIFTNNKKEVKLSKEEYIQKILETEDYSYLPEPAKNYIASVYEETGEVIKTENNKEEGEPYLNPRYVEYLVSNNRSTVNSAFVKESNKKVVDNYGLIPKKTIIDYYKSNIVSTYSDNELPSAYDLRKVNGNNYVTPIKNQEDLEICWAFAANAQFESYLLKKNNQTYTSDATIFSERQMDYALSNNGINEYNNEEFAYRLLGGGGNFRQLTNLAKEGLSFVSQKDWKKIYINYFNKNYVYNDLSKMELNDIFNYNNSLYEVNSTVEMPYLNTGDYNINSKEYSSLKDSYLTLVKNYIMEYGGAYVGTSAPGYGCSFYDNNLDNYIIYDNNKCEYGGHALQIIGWDDSVEYEFCAATNLETDNTHSTDISNCSDNNKVKGKGVWILKNSWGETSDEYTSYTYLAYDSLYTEIDVITDVSLSENKQWEYSESASSVRYGSNFNINSDKHYIYYGYKDLNENKELKLNKIKFYTYDSNTTYNLFIAKTGKVDKFNDIYNDIEEEVKLEEKLTKEFVFVDSINIESPGLYTFDISDKNLILKDGYVWGIERTNDDLPYMLDISHYYSIEDDNTEVITYNASYKNKKNTKINDPYKLYVYSDTINIKSDSVIDYKLYDLEGNDISNNLTYKYNKVGKNNVNSLLTISNSVEPGEYILKTLYENQIKSESKVFLSEIKVMTGTGTSDDPYIITTPDELYMINDDMSANYKLGNDIDLTFDTTNPNGKFYNNGKGWISIGGYEQEIFDGTLDGNNYTIKGLYKKDSIYNGGLFHVIAPVNNLDINIKNLNFENCYIHSKHTFYLGMANYVSYEGVLAAGLSDALYDSSYIEDDVSIDISNISVVNSYVSGKAHAGGLFGVVHSSKNGSININNIYTNARVVSTDDNFGTRGGVIGSIYIQDNLESDAYISVDNILNIGDIDTNAYLETENFAGGVIGEVTGKLKLNNVITSTKINYIEWSNPDINYDHPISYGEVIGKINKEEDFSGEAELNNIYYTGDIVPVISGNSYISDNIEKKSITELKDESLYSKWSGFKENWKIEIFDNIKRIPVLSFLDFQYFKVNEIDNLYNGVSSNLYDYIFPNNNIIKNRTNFIIDDPKIATVDEFGNITGLKVGQTTLHISSEYDGYEADVSIVINAPKYILTFNSNYNNEKYIQNFGDNESKLNSNKFSRVGYNFKELNTKTDRNGTRYKNEQSILLNDSITLYAIWEPIKYKVKFVHDNKFVEQEFTYDQKQKLKTNTFVKTGYSFVEWLFGGDSNIRYKDGQEVINLTSEEKTITLYATWGNNKYYVKFNPNGGIGKMDNMFMLYDVKYNLPDNLFVKDGHVFKMWNTKSDGTGTSYKNKEEVSSLTAENGALFELYAIWEKISGIHIENYSVEQNNKFIKNVKSDTTVEQFRKNIITDGSYEVKIEYKTTNNKNYVYTGGKTKIYKNNELVYSYTNIVTGDISGDGFINSADLLRVRQHLLGTKKSENEYFVASDVNYDNEINSADLLRIRQHLLGIKDIE